MHTYTLDIGNKTIRKVLTTDVTSHIVSCTLLNEDTVVCGMWKSTCSTDILDDCIRLYDRQWKLIKNIAIPRNSKGDLSWVDVSVDMDGMIIVAESHQTNIYIINPTDGGIVNTIICKGKITLCGTLSSGNFIACPYPRNHKILSIDRMRKEAQTEIAVGGKIYDCAIDRLTEDLYPVHREEGQDVFVIDHLKLKDEEKARNILQYTPVENVHIFLN